MLCVHGPLFAAPPIQLHDNRAFFPRLLELIGQSERSIQANIHIWRDDRIGNEVAAALLRAADRGVRVTLSKDLVGGGLERGEETGQSMLHKQAPCSVRRIEAGVKLMYPDQILENAGPQRDNPLARALETHPHISLEKDGLEYDHAKYFILDDAVLLVGGVNLEDKEVDRDILGRVYDDYMVELRDPEAVARFRRRLEDPALPDPTAPIDILHNNRPLGWFGSRAGILALLEEARTSVVVQNPYWGDRAIAEKLIEVANRGIEVTLIIPARANITHDLNRRVMRRIYLETGGRARILLADRMVHAKMLYIDRRILMVGSANFNRVSLDRSTEVGIVLREIDPGLRDQVEGHLERIKAHCRPVAGEGDLEHSPFRAFVESLVQGS